MSRTYDAASEILDTLVADWPTDPDVASPLPTGRQYVNWGNVIWDCEQLVVTIERTFGHLGDVSAEQIDVQPLTMAVRAVTIGVWIIRCVPDIDASGERIILPTPHALDDSAKLLAADTDVVLAILAKAQRKNQLLACGSVGFENAIAQGPEGGFSGGVTRLRVGLL